ncbi:MAG: phosphatidylglycerophosphatase A [Acidimicrobiia bacterium]
MARIVASFFGSGLILGRLRGSHRGSGTVGAALALGISLLLPPVYGRLAALGASIVFGIWSINQLMLGDDDPGWVVIDEAAGTFLATIGLAPVPALVAWMVFRVADIFKNVFPGVKAAERLSSGIMADDLVAGLYGLAAGWIVNLGLF